MIIGVQYSRMRCDVYLAAPCIVCNECNHSVYAIVSISVQLYATLMLL